MRKLVACLVALVATTAANAAPIISNSQGWVNSAGVGNGGFNGNNTFTGNEFGNQYNSWASFSLPSFAGTVTSATLTLDLSNYPFGDLTNYSVGIYDVNTSLTSLQGATSGVAGYTDLGTGNLYATTTSPGLVTINLSPQAIADLNAASGGTFIIGFTNLTLNPQNPNGVDIGYYNNGFGGGSPPQLNVTLATPEPVSLLVFGGLLAGGGWLVRRRMKANVA
jgi:hypothetical protein